MSELRALLSRQPVTGTGAAIGVPGYLAILVVTISLALMAPSWVLLCMAVLEITITFFCVPGVFRPLVRARWLILCAVLILPSIFLSGNLDRQFLNIPYSSQGLTITFLSILRMIVIFLVVSIFTSSVEISALAGIFERLGLHGLGFSLGVALNLLPSLNQSALTTWRVLQIRGGFRHQRWKGLRLMTITVITQALNRAEEIALAAEVRAFTPEKAQAYPIVKGRFDKLIIFGSVLMLVLAIVIRVI
ncbi:MAG: energy-coupling factor transporter transmembrane protein EcfT [Chloroflexi bacterium]|nr:energy-coupling factor transporter transmembrane protein EcfT [Chloroflexota bacterium]